jgi:hypothetical protein
MKIMTEHPGERRGVGAPHRLIGSRLRELACRRVPDSRDCDGRVAFAIRHHVELIELLECHPLEIGTEREVAGVGRLRVRVIFHLAAVDADALQYHGLAAGVVRRAEEVDAAIVGRKLRNARSRCKEAAVLAICADDVQTNRICSTAQGRVGLHDPIGNALAVA